MIQIRQNVFETNSSSTHAVAIPTRNAVELRDFPKKINFKVGYYTSVFEEVKPSSYLYTAIALLTGGTGKKFHKYIKTIDEALDGYGIKYFYEPLPKTKDGKLDETVCYIAHYQELKSWVDSLILDPSELVLFLIKGRVFTGRDEVEEEVERFQVFRGAATYNTKVSSPIGVVEKKVPNPYYIPGYSWTYLYLC